VQTLNNQVACTPLENTAVKTKKIGSLEMADFGHGGKLLKLKVVVPFCGCLKDYLVDLPVGSDVYLKADCIQHAWTKAICTCEEVKGPFILVPVEQVIMYNGPDCGLSVED
jgi:hypothetical protein